MQKNSSERSRETSLRDVLAEITQDYVRQQKPASFHITIPGIGEIVCTEVFRVIFSKRIVCLGQANENYFIVKLYFAKHGAIRHWKRSDRGCRAFVEQRIPAPGILFSGYIPDYGLYAMVFEYLRDAIRIDSALEACSDSLEREEVLSKLMTCFASLHEHGILQHDLHLGNFMIKDGVIYSLDGDQVVNRRGPVGRKRSLTNLALLLANLPVYVAFGLDTWIDAYARERNWSISDDDRADLKNMALRIRRKNLSQYLRKVLNSRDPFLASSGHGFFSVFDKRHFVVSLLEILDAAKRSKPAHGALGKAGYKCVTRGNENMILLSSYCVGPLIFKGLWGTVRTWRNALMLGRIGLMTPPPVALAIMKGTLFHRCSIFFKSMEGMPIKDYFHSTDVPAEAKAIVATDLADAFNRMEAMRITVDRIDPGKIIISDQKVVFLNPGIFRRSIFNRRSKQTRMLGRFLADCKDIAGLKEILLKHLKMRTPT